MKKSVYDKGKIGVYRSAVKNDEKCVQCIDDEITGVMLESRTGNELLKVHFEHLRIRPGVVQEC